MLDHLQLSVNKLENRRNVCASAFSAISGRYGSPVLAEGPCLHLDSAFLPCHNIDWSAYHVKGLFLGHAYDQSVSGNGVSHLCGPFRMFVLQRNLGKGLVKGLGKIVEGLDLDKIEHDLVISGRQPLHPYHYSVAIEGGF